MELKHLDELEELHAQSDAWLQELSELPAAGRSRAATPWVERLLGALRDEEDMLTRALRRPDALLEALRGEVALLLRETASAAERDQDWRTGLDELRTAFEALFLASEEALRDD